MNFAVNERCDIAGWARWMQIMSTIRFLSVSARTVRCEVGTRGGLLFITWAVIVQRMWFVFSTEILAPPSSPKSVNYRWKLEFVFRFNVLSDFNADDLGSLNTT